MGMPVDDGRSAFLDTSFEHIHRWAVEATWCVQTNAGDSVDLLELAWGIDPAPKQMFREALRHRSIRNPTEGITSLAQRTTEPAKIRSIPARQPSLREAERIASRIVIRLVVRRNECADRRA